MNTLTIPNGLILEQLDKYQWNLSTEDYSHQVYMEKKHGYWEIGELIENEDGHLISSSPKFIPEEYYIGLDVSEEKYVLNKAIEILTN